MSRNWTWYRPTSLYEAVGLLIAYGADSVIVAGGTSVGLNPPRRDGLSMIDLQKLELTTVVRMDGVTRLGALVTAHTLTTSDQLDSVGSGLLRVTGSTMGPRPVRNRITLGGNVMQPFRWSDLPVSLLALDAKFELYGPKGFRTIAADELLATQPRRQLLPGELLAWADVAVDAPGEGGCFLKLHWTKVDHAVASVAVKLALVDGRCDRLRLALGALAPLPQRWTSVEEALVGTELDDESIAQGLTNAQPSRVVAEQRAEADYKLQVARTLAARALRTARDHAKGGVA